MTIPGLNLRLDIIVEIDNGGNALACSDCRFEYAATWLSGTGSANLLCPGCCYYSYAQALMAFPFRKWLFKQFWLLWVDCNPVLKGLGGKMIQLCLLV